MEQYISKSALVAEIERRISVLEANESVISILAGGMFVNEFKDLLSFLDNLEVKEVDLKKELDFNAEVSKFINTFYKNTKIGHKLMIRRTAKYFYDLGLKAKGEIYVVTRSEEHADYVECAFLSESKAEEYCKPFNEDENRYARNITKAKIQ